MEHTKPKWPDDQLQLQDALCGFAIHFCTGAGQVLQYFAGRLIDRQDDGPREFTVFAHREFKMKKGAGRVGMQGRIETASYDADLIVSATVGRLERLKAAVPDHSYLADSLYDGESWRVIVSSAGVIDDFSVYPDKDLELNHPTIQELQAILLDARQSRSEALGLAPAAAGMRPLRALRRLRTLLRKPSSAG